MDVEKSFLDVNFTELSQNILSIKQTVDITDLINSTDQVITKYYNKN